MLFLLLVCILCYNPAISCNTQ